MTQSAKEFFQSLKENPELGKQFDAELKKIAEEKSAQSDGEAIVKAARAMGYDFAEADMEKAFVSMQELDPEEMEKAAGGEFCWSDYDCFTILHHDSPNDFHHECFWTYACIIIHFGS